ncbi:hypothetical protein FQN54_001875 [Arachnomyces sp. PD_36]|nr:hypothetical protein FQN54_001875 [Arachnomyces sp. PD_36]
MAGRTGTRRALTKSADNSRSTTPSHSPNRFSVRRYFRSKSRERSQPISWPRRRSPETPVTPEPEIPKLPSIELSQKKLSQSFIFESSYSPPRINLYRPPSLPIVPTSEEEDLQAWNRFPRRRNAVVLSQPNAESDQSGIFSTSCPVDRNTCVTPTRDPNIFLRADGWQNTPGYLTVDIPSEPDSPLIKSFPATPTEMTRSQSSAGHHEPLREEQNPPLNPIAQASTGAPAAGSNGQSVSSNPTNLSGLVCNVHRTTGREPHALVGATTTILGDKLYVLGGRVLSRTRPQLTSDLYELDLIRRHWTKLETSGDILPPRYFHSVCPLGDTKLVCYGGMSPSTNQSTSTSASSQDGQPEVVVMSDIHIFDVPTRTWMRIPTTDTPQGRYAHCATILPSSAVFASATAPLSAIQNNPASSNPHQGSIGVDINGVGGAEMVVVGGQDSSNHYIEQISVFNLRSLKWTNTSPLGRSCGAYRSVVAPLTGIPASEIGQGSDNEANKASNAADSKPDAPSMLIYSNYNFLDVKLELQVRQPDGQLSEKPMNGQVSPPGLRFPNGGVINGHFVVSGTYLTSSKQEYALWALDLKTLTWGRIDAGGAIFGHGSWNRGVLWDRRNTFVIMGHRKRSLVEDYNHRRINFSHICLVELEAFGLYNNPRKSDPTSGYISVSAPVIPASLQPKFAQQTAGGRPYSRAAEELGRAAMGLREVSDMEILTIGGERIPVNSHILARRWGPYFVQLLRESTGASGDGISDSATLRPGTHSHPSRNSSITITPSIGNNSTFSGSATLINNAGALSDPKSSPSLIPNLEIPSAHTLAPTSRLRTLYLPHTYLTVQLLVHYIYTSSLPPVGSSLCTPQILCSLLQLARPYQVDGLLEAIVERLHDVLDGRNAAAVFNAAAMAAGGGRGTGFTSGPGGTLEVLNGAHANEESSSAIADDPSASSGTEPGGHHRTYSANRPSNLRINTNVEYQGIKRGKNNTERDREDSMSSTSTATSASTSTSLSLTDSEAAGGAAVAGTNTGRRRGNSGPGREIWTGDVSNVIGLQKRGLRGLMEGRRLRERGAKPYGGSGGGEGDPTGISAVVSATATGQASGSTSGNTKNSELPRQGLGIS